MDDSLHRTTLTTLYGLHQPWLKRWLYRRLGCQEVAADLAQDTFVKVLGRSGLEDIQQPRAYLSTIAHGLFVNLLRRRQLEQRYLEAVSSLPEVQLPSPETHWQLLEALCAIDTMLDGLPRSVRTAFLLAQLEGLTHRQIAQQLAVSQSSVRQYIARALVHCMAAITQENR